MPDWFEFPALGRDTLAALRRTVDGEFRAFTREHGQVLERLFEPLRDLLMLCERLLTQSPWPLVLGAIVLVAWVASRSRAITVGTAVTLVLIGVFGMWEDTMKTVAMIAVSTFVALVIGAMPPPEEFADGRQDRAKFAARAGSLVSAAAETFNDGLRAYYFSFAAMAWFFSPIALVLATVLVVLILYGREFKSDVLEVLRDEN